MSKAIGGFSSPSLSILTSLALVCAIGSVAAGMTDTSTTEDTDFDTGSTAAEEEVVYYQRLTVDSDGTGTVSASGSNVVTLEDGTEYTVTMSELSDPDGNRYYLVGDSWQEEEGGEVTHEMRLVRYSPTTLSEEEIEDSWLDANPGATKGDQEDFCTRRASASTMEGVDDPVHVDQSIQDWAALADSDDLHEVNVLLREQPALDLPQVANDQFDTDPVFALSQWEDRLIAIESRKTAIETLQEDLVEDLVDLGATKYHPFWLVNSFQIQVTPAALSLLEESDDVERVELIAEMEPESNRGSEIRQASQIRQYLNAGFDGETASGRNLSVGDIYIGVIDSKVDINHPAWLDSSGGSSRLVAAYQWDTGTASWIEDTAGTSTTSHGTRVAGQLLAHLGDAQDPNYPDTADTAEQAARSGMTTESSFVAIDLGSGGAEESWQLAMSENVDIVNYSHSCSSCSLCDIDHSNNNFIDAAMKDGIFVAKGAGNSGATSTACNLRTSCEVTVPGTASGAFVAGGYSRTASSLIQAPLGSTSPYGVDSKGRHIIDLVAVNGREGNSVAEWNDTYAPAGGGQSYAGPVIAGAAANLKHHVINVFGTTPANVVGNMHAWMLLMGDGQLSNGNFAQAGDEHDECWGAGRIRMRMFNSPGMDAPWRRRWFNWVLDADEETVWDVNPDSYGVNQEVPTDVEWFKAALWWHEPNMGTTQSPAEVALRITRPGVSYGSGSTKHQKQRLWLGNAIGGETWQVKVDALNLPVSTETDYFYNQSRRRMHLAFFWEERSSDDTDGPNMDTDDPSGPDTGMW